MFPKNDRHQNRALLDLAKGKPCLLTAVFNCETVHGATTVAAHSNWSDLGGKGAHRKADDQFTVWACVNCHSWLDQSSAPKAEKRRAWLAGHARQKTAWAQIAKEGGGKEKEAAHWALERLKESHPVKP